MKTKNYRNKIFLNLKGDAENNEEI